MRTVAVIASDPMEFAGILAHSEPIASPASPAGFLRRVRLADIDLILAADGVGATRASAAVDATIEFRPEAIVSTGFCGALDPTLAIADIVVATRVIGNDAEFAVGHVASPRNHATGVVCSVDHVVSTAAEKRQLRTTGALAVEMEAAGVAMRARVLGLPFYCVRAVSDLAGEDMANDFNRALTPGGHFDTIILLRGAFARPLARIPELLRLRRRCRCAAKALGDFFADCRF